MPYKDPEKQKKYNRTNFPKWYAKNKEAHTKAGMAWYAKNKEAYNKARREKYAKKKAGSA